jgi:hypothetical protein
MGEDIRFAHFIAVLALNPDELKRYKKDPEAAMEAAGLSEEEKGLLRKGDFRLICEFLGDTGPRPITYGT